MSSYFRYLQLFINYSKRHGLLAALARAKAHVFNSEMRSHTNYIHKYYMPKKNIFLSQIEANKLTGSDAKREIVWIMPTFNRGSGGHTTIFRFAKYFELIGYHNKFVIRNSNENSNSNLKSQKELVNELNRYFYAPLQNDVVTYANNMELLKDINNIEGDWVIGTCIHSQLIALNVKNANKRYFFLQDNEPLFAAADEFTAFNNALLADLENEFICAGKWLHSLVANMNSSCFQLGVDHLKTFVLKQFAEEKSKNDSLVKIAVYARFSTSRRCVDLAWSYLIKLQEMGINFEVHAFGQDIDIGNSTFPFKIKNHGILSQNQMYRLLLNSDMCIALSATNYSLLPNEAAALGIISVDLDTPQNRLCYANSPVNLVGPEVKKAANQLSNLILEKQRQPSKKPGKAQAQKAIQDMSWINQYGHIHQHLTKQKQSPNKFKVSVCIPVRNGGEKFEMLLLALQRQTLVDIELCIIDTESSDGSIDIAKKMFPGVKLKSISKAEFGHGKTRNELANMASNEYLLYLTQDSIPLDELLTITLAKHVLKNPKIFGSFCKHVAYPSHSPFVADKIEKHFETIAQMFSSSNFSTSRQESLKYRFFSTNCCLVRRSCLMEHPFPEINYGEDQLWSFTMLENGWGVAFVPDMAVLHSHDYDGDEIREMTRTDLEYHKVHFQEFPVWSQKHHDDETVSISKEINATAQEVHDELRKNKIRMDAYNEARLSKEVSYNK